MTRTAVSFRDATAADLPIVMHFVQALAEYEGLLHEVVATEADFRSSLFDEPRRAHALFAERDARPVGFAVWYFSFSTFVGRPSLYVEDVFVDPAHRNAGIGRAIFRHLARRALEAGCGRMEWAVLDWNAPSIAFYRSLGAQTREGWTMQRLSGRVLEALAASQ